MTGQYLLASASDEWEQRVRRAFDGQLNGELRRGGDALLLGRLESAFDEIAGLDAPVVVVGPDVALNDALEFARLVDERRPDVCTVLVADPTAEVLEHAVRAGVRDVVAADAALTDLRGSLEHALDTATRRRAVLRGPAAERQTSKVITVVSPKGGAGKTAIATNLAVGLARRSPNDVVVVDLDVQFGDVANALRLTPERTLADVARSAAAVDATTLKAFLTPHPAGVFVLCAPDSPADADDVTTELIGKLLDLLRDNFSYVVIDTAAGLDETTLTAMEHSSDLVVVCATDVASTRGVRKELEAFDMLGLTTQRRHFALNRADARVGLTASDIEATVGLDVTVAIPSSRAVPLSMNQGTPLLESDQRSPVSRALGELVNRFSATPGAPEPAPGPTGLFRRSKEGR